MKRKTAKRQIAMLFVMSLTAFAFCKVSDFFIGDAKLFRLDPLYDGIIGGGALALNAGVVLYDHFDGVPAYDGIKPELSSVSAFDRWAARPYSRTLHITGTVTEAVAMAAPFLLAFTDKGEWGILAVMYAESVLWANGLKELAKTFVPRYRPYMYFNNPPTDKVEDGDFARSFPSGHTTMAFNGAVFTSYVFAKYFPASKFKIPVVAGSMTLALATAVQRVLSGNHFVTDVLAGAVLGSVTGFLVPFLHTLPIRTEKLDVAVSPVGLAVTYRF